MTKSCKHCQADFLITDSDLDFYNKIVVPSPTHCPQCRLQRRLAWRNERQLYQRQCDLCHKIMIASFSAAAPFPVYCSTCFWSDQWDPSSYGRDFDFSRSFFEQFHGLQLTVPKMGVLQLNCENSSYNALIAFSKNTYMSPGSYCIEDCYFVRKSQYCKDCVNSNLLDHCELVGSSTNCRNCYQSHHLLNCRDCTHSSYLADCSGCKDCFMCSGLVHKQYYYKNQAHSEADYRALVAKSRLISEADLTTEWLEFNNTIPKKYQNQLHCEKSSGDYLYDSNQARHCFDCFDIQNSKYLTDCVDVKDSMDLTMHDKEIELCYEICSGGEKNYDTKFSYCVIAANHSDYLYSCFYLTDSFGCDGFHARARNHILNKAYTPEAYQTLRTKIIEHMKSTGEYGEFFPISHSMTAYNDSLAQDYFPLTQAQAVTQGYRWNEEIKPISLAVDAIDCQKCGKEYKCIPQELGRYEQLNLTVPTLCPNCRFQELLSWKNPRRLWQRSCMCIETLHDHTSTSSAQAPHCATQFETTYAPERIEQVYCEACYRKSIY